MREILRSQTFQFHSKLLAIRLVMGSSDSEAFDQLRSEQPATINGTASNPNPTLDLKIYRLKSQENSQVEARGSDRMIHVHRFARLSSPFLLPFRKSCTAC